MKKLLLRASIICIIIFVTDADDADTVEETRTVEKVVPEQATVVRAVPKDVVTQVTTVGTGVTDLVKQVKRLETKLNLILERVITRKRQISSELDGFENGVDQILSLLSPSVTDVKTVLSTKTIVVEEKTRRKKRHGRHGFESKAKQTAKRRKRENKAVLIPLPHPNYRQRLENAANERTRLGSRRSIPAQSLAAETAAGEAQTNPYLSRRSAHSGGVHRRGGEAALDAGPAAGRRRRRDVDHLFRLALDGGRAVLVQQPAADEAARPRRRAEEAEPDTLALWRQAELGPAPVPEAARGRRRAAADADEEEQAEGDPVPDMEREERNLSQADQAVQADDDASGGGDGSDGGDNDGEDDDEAIREDSEESDDGGDDAMSDDPAPVMADGSSVR